MSSKIKKFGSQKFGKQFWEFVYLDEVAIQSLSATLNGAIVEKIVQKNSKNGSGQAHVRSPLPAGTAEVSFGISKASEREIHERAVAESLFATLRKELRSQGFMAATVNEKRLKVRNSQSAKKILNQSIKNRKGVHAIDLVRGTPFEVEIEILPPKLYLATAALESTIAMAKHVAKLAGEENDFSSNPDTIMALTKAFSWFHSGNVPLRGKVTSHVLYTDIAEGKKYILPTEVGKLLKQKSSGEIEEITIAGFCDDSKFWQQPTRVLRRTSKFVACARLEEVTPVLDWSDAENLKDLEALSPQFAAAARAAYETASATIGTDIDNEPRQENFSETMRKYATILRGETRKEPNPDALVEVLSQPLAAESPASLEPADRNQLLREIEALFEISPSDKSLQIEMLRNLAQENLQEPENATINQQDIGPIWRVRFLALYW